MTTFVSRFEIVAAELRTLGLTIRRLPGEYLINLRNGGDETARYVEDLDQALEVGRELAAEAAANRVADRQPKRRKQWRKKMTPKARRRRFIRAHNRRVRAKAMRKI